MEDEESGAYKYLEKGYPPGEMYKVLLIIKRNDAIDSLEAFMKLERSGGSGHTRVFGSRIAALFIDLRATIKKFYKKEEFEAIEKQIYSENINELVDAFNKMNDLLLKINLTNLTMSKEQNLKMKKPLDDAEVWER